MARISMMLLLAACTFAACADEVPVKDMGDFPMHGAGVGIVLASFVLAACGIMIVRWIVKRDRKDVGGASSAT